MTSLMGSSVFTLNWRNVSYRSSGYCKSDKKIVNLTRPSCCSIAPQNIKPAAADDEFRSSKLQV